jgi:tRNA A37 threonylcarbamoyltransferase TsaD
MRFSCIKLVSLLMLLLLLLLLLLQVGVRHALQLSAQHQLPWVAVHHMEAHALMAATNLLIQVSPG